MSSQGNSYGISIPLENIKLSVFVYFQGVWKETSDMKWLNYG